MVEKEQNVKAPARAKSGSSAQIAQAGESVKRSPSNEGGKKGGKKKKGKGTVTATFFVGGVVAIFVMAILAVTDTVVFKAFNWALETAADAQQTVQDIATEVVDAMTFAGDVATGVIDAASTGGILAIALPDHYKKAPQEMQERYRKSGITIRCQDDNTSDCMPESFEYMDGGRKQTAPASDFLELKRKSTKFRDAVTAANSTRYVSWFDDTANEYDTTYEVSRDTFSETTNKKKRDTSLLAMIINKFGEVIGSWLGFDVYAAEEEELTWLERIREVVDERGIAPTADLEKSSQSASDAYAPYDKLVTILNDSSNSDKDLIKAGIKEALSGMEGTCNLRMSAYTIAQALQSKRRQLQIAAVSDTLEAIDKAMIGYSNSAMVEYTVGSLTKASKYKYYDNNGRLVESTDSKTPMQSAGMRYLLSNELPKTNDASFKIYSTGGVASLMQEFVNNIVSEESEANEGANRCPKGDYIELTNKLGHMQLEYEKNLDIEGGKVSGGIGAAIQSWLGWLWRLITGTELARYDTDSPIVEQTIDETAEILSGLYSGADVEGLSKGDLLAASANSYMGDLAKRGGAMPMTKTQAVAFYRQTNVVLAKKADYDRRNLSPFSLDSRYTFFGTLAYSLVAHMSTTKPTMVSLLTSISSMTLSSIASILPTAQAAGEARYLEALDACNNEAYTRVNGGDMACTPDGYPTYGIDMDVARIHPKELKNKLGTNIIN
ncbi:MAG: hypothetical protein LBL84_03305, partial [Candidatus Nomurabacteria bacterium]|nr:hypothetical protein [Candidatus Nomurabacteria bacterium]